MIVFDLKCAGGHVFESWFGSSEDYESQAARSLVACPLCGSAKVEKAIMAPAVAAKGNRKTHSPAEVKQALAAMAELQDKIVASSDYVGDRFAEEARAIHLGEADARAIYGEATAADADALRDEGIAVAPLPFRPRRTADA